MATDTVSIDEFLSARKGFVKSGDVLLKGAAGIPSWNKDTRSARFVMSAEVEDRDKDIVVQQGLDLTEFSKNPVALLSHRASDFPVGKWSEVEQNLTGRPKRTEGTVTLVPQGTDGVADRLAFHMGEGSIRACSIGFIPKTVRRRDVAQPSDGYVYPGYMIEEAELLECSIVTLPANPAALAKAASDGDVQAREVIERVLDEWVKNPANGLLMPRAELEAAYERASGSKSVVTLGGKTFKIEEVQLPASAPAAAEAETRSLLGEIKGILAKAFPPAKSAEEIAREVAEKATRDADEAKSLELELAVLEGRLEAKLAA